MFLDGQALFNRGGRFVSPTCAILILWMNGLQGLRIIELDQGSCYKKGLEKVKSRIQST